MLKLKKLLIALIFISFTIFTFSIVNAASDFDLKKLDFDVSLNSNGNMDVTETWSIKVNGETNTLFKTFEKDSSKYEGIKDVKVVEVKSDGSEVDFTKINNLMYHVTTNCYYGLDNDNRDFEIAWGINVSSGTKTYKVSYTVEGAISRYEDLAELYWQFIGNDFEIPADSVTGKIVLPASVKDIDNLRVWGHRWFKWRYKKNF